MTDFPESRLSAVNDAGVDPGGDFVVYWMIAHRRARYNFAFDRAVDRARELGKPLVVLEALRCGYRWASARLHRFVLQGMAENRRQLAGTQALYYPYVERAEGEGSGLLEALADRAAVVVTDEFPCFFLPRMVAAAGRRLPVRLEQVDGNGLLPLRATDRAFKRAVDLRRFLQKHLPPHLVETPRKSPLAGISLPTLERLPRAITERWPAATEELLAATPEVLAELPVDPSVPPVGYDGGSAAAEEALERFLDHRLGRYDDDRNALADRATSELSPYLHFGHLSAHQVFLEVAEREGWHPGELGDRANGARAGWWGMSPAAEGYLDQLVTWRELGYNMCFHRDDYHRYDALPEWARETLGEHEADPRPHVYELEDFERARTHDEVWNAAQRELVRDGRIHNYLRMLWGKKILEWSPTPRDAAEVMIELNNKYAVDGRNPNSYSGIFWCLGRYDRPWGPEREIFGKIRYMSSDSARRKLHLGPYLAEFGDQLELF
jgi:deoxyribodipyrimidine photo-lyase